MSGILVFFIRETQISKTKCIEICKSNPAYMAGLKAEGIIPPSLGAIFGYMARPGVHTRNSNS
jgi:hypothetical protein